MPARAGASRLGAPGTAAPAEAGRLATAGMRGFAASIPAVRKPQGRPCALRHGDGRRLEGQLTDRVAVHAHDAERDVQPPGFPLMRMAKRKAVAGADGEGARSGRGAHLQRRQLPADARALAARPAAVASAFRRAVGSFCAALAYRKNEMLLLPKIRRPLSAMSRS
jgi:hypothetical protein